MIIDEPVSPVPGLGLEAYTSQLVAHPGDTIEVMASGLGGAALTVVRLIHGDPNPSGPGYKDMPAAWSPPLQLELTPQTIDFGSFIRIPGDAELLGAGDFSFCVWIKPTLLNPGWNTIAAMWATNDISFGIFGAGKTLVAGLSTDGTTVQWLAAKEFLYPGVWQLVALSYDQQRGAARLFQAYRSDHRRATPHDIVVSEQRLAGGPVHRSRADLHLGALPPVHPGQIGHWAHFNGKLGGPRLSPVQLDESLVGAIFEGGEAEMPFTARWDLSRDVATDKIWDTSGNGHHGTAVNMPARAVTGVGYERNARYVREGSYRRRPGDYDAIHLHEDDLDDAGWHASATIQVPADADPGVYAVRLSNEGDRVTMPVVVSRLAAQADLVVLMPTFTWTAYTTNRSPYSFTRDGVLDRGNSLYNVHSDGSPVYYVTRRRPTRSHDPTAGFEQRGAHKITANLYLIDWLEQQGLDYEVTTDDDLDERGVDALGFCRTLILGSHPEYWTPRMLSVLESHLRRGGRVLYLGSEFMLWVATVDPLRPWVMEVRKSEGGDYHPPLLRPAGEAEHSTEPVLGGAWAERGRHARNLVGVEVAAQAWFDVGVAGGQTGFIRSDASTGPACDWVFEGVDEHPIGGYGLNFGSAAWMEMDGALDREWMPGVERVVLATARHDDYWSALAETPSADLSLTTYPNGAAIFAAGSLTWTGSLSHDGYVNGVSRITRNVIDRFLSTPTGASVLK